MAEQGELGLYLQRVPAVQLCVYLMCTQEAPGSFQVLLRVQTAPDDFNGVHDVLDTTTNSCAQQHQVYHQLVACRSRLQSHADTARSSNKRFPGSSTFCQVMFNSHEARNTSLT